MGVPLCLSMQDFPFLVRDFVVVAFIFFGVFFVCVRGSFCEVRSLVFGRATIWGGFFSFLSSSFFSLRQLFFCFPGAIFSEAEGGFRNVFCYFIGFPLNFFKCSWTLC